MFTTYIGIQVKPNEKKEQPNANPNKIKYSNPQKHQKIFTTPNLATSCRSAKSYDNPLNWSCYSFQQRQQSPQKQTGHSTFRIKKQDKDAWHNLEPEEKKSYQILIKQSLRRSFTTRRQNRSSQEVRDMDWMNNSRKLSHDMITKNKEDILDFLNELEGKRCPINKNTKTRTPSTQARTRKSKSLQAKPNSKTSKQLKIETDDEQKQNIIKQTLQQPVMAIGMAAKRDNLTNSDKGHHHEGSGKKIAISTTQCLIFTQPSSKKPINTGLYVESQANFIRAKKKSKALHKKVANFCQEQQDQAHQPQPQKLSQSRIHEFKNSLTKNVNLSISNCQNIPQPKKPNNMKNVGKRQENIKIQGWEIVNGGGWDMDGNF